MAKSLTEMTPKRVAIDKANAQMVAVVAAAAFVTVFCLVAAHAVWNQNSYQARLTSAQEKAHQQLLQNIKAYSSLSSSYQSFISGSTNFLGGPSSGTGNNEGNNGQLILDALPSSYDFPALTSSIEKVLASQGLNITNITGTDDELAQQNNTTSNNPQPVPIPFGFTISDTDYTAVSQVIAALQHSIRPLAIDSIDLSGGNGSMTLTVNAHTYYQPAKNLSITKKVVK